MPKYLTKLKIAQLCNANPLIKEGWDEFIKENSDKTDKILYICSSGDLSGWWGNFCVHIKYENIGYIYEWSYCDDGYGNTTKQTKRIY